MSALTPLLFALALQGQAPADTALLDYTVRGVRVIHQPRNPATDVFAVQLYLMGGARAMTAANAGIESLMLDATAYGTTHYPGEANRRALARTGAQIGVGSGADWTVISLEGLKADFDSAWAIFADRIVSPTLDSASVELVRQRMIGRATRRSVSPEDYAWILADSLAFAGHPYAVNPNGTPESLKAITVDAVRAYHKQNLVTSRMVLVVVGDLPPERVELLVKATLGSLPAGEYKWSLPATIAPTKRSVAVAMRSVRTNYIVATAFGPARSSPQFPAFERAMEIYGSWVSSYVRGEASLSYSAGIVVVDQGVPYARFYVSTNNADSVMRIVNNLRSALVENFYIPRTFLRKSAEGFQHAYMLQNETASGAAAALGSATLLEGDPKAAARKAQVMGKVAAFELRRVMIDYAGCFQFAYVGDTLKTPRELMLGKDPKCK